MAGAAGASHAREEGVWILLEENQPLERYVPMLGAAAQGVIGGRHRGAPTWREAGVAKGLPHLHHWRASSGRVNQPVGKGEPQDIIYLPTLCQPPSQKAGDDSSL